MKLTRNFRKLWTAATRASAAKAGRLLAQMVARLKPCPTFRYRLGGPVLGAVMILLVGCGYHTVGAATHVPANVRTLSVPIFQSRVQAYGTEIAFTEAVVRELNTRTKYRVVPSASGSPDATLTGAIVAQTITPLTYDPTSGQTSSYLVSITAKVELVSQEGTVLYRNDAMAWHEQYQSTQDLSGFVQEDGSAMRRVASAFAKALVSDMMESFR